MTLFMRDPSRYIPQYGGWCAFGFAMQPGEFGSWQAGPYPIDPASFKIERLFGKWSNKVAPASVL